MLRSTSSAMRPATLLPLVLLAGACSLVNAPDDVKAGAGGSDATTSSAGGSTTTSTDATTTTTSTTTSTTSTTTSTTSTSSTGMEVCTPGMTQDCYSGPAGTDGVGLCKAGQQTCNADGSDWGPCDGEVTPVAEDCNTLADEDCDGKTNQGCLVKAVVVAAAYNPAYLSDVAQKEKSKGLFAKVDVFDAAAATPTLQDLEAYDVALVFSDSPGFKDPVALGNNLADYFDAGGRVVVATFANTASPTLQVQGKFGDPAAGYMLVDVQAQEGSPDTLGAILEPNSPLVLGVSTFKANAAYRSSGGPINGGVVVAQWATGKPLIVRGVVQGRNRVDLNMYPPSDAAAPGSGFWTGNGTEIIRNALLFQ